ncbi:Peptidyl-prolyl cis-trans isomerase FKBP62 [Bienertia sinuspersici]
MISMEECEKFKGELRDLLIEGENLDREDVGCLFDYISTLENPKGILEHVKECKDEGNLAFKKGDVDGALEKYGFGGVFLTWVVIKREEDKAIFLDLASSILLNMAACMLKKKEFMQAGQLCTVVLDYNPANVKALFRRASAAMELGRNDLAYSDLKLACAIEPTNQEVVKKLSKVEYILQNDAQTLNPDQGALGLDSNPSSLSYSSDRIVSEKEYQDKFCKMEPKKDKNGDKTTSTLDKSAKLDHVYKDNDIVNEVKSIEEGMSMDNEGQVSKEAKNGRVEMKYV